MKYKEYIVVVFKEVDYIATSETNLRTIIEWYKKEYNDDLELDDVQILTDLERKKEIILIYDDTKAPMKTNCDKLLNQMIKSHGNHKYIYLYGTEW